MTEDLRAAVVMRSTSPAFKDFRSDATCEIRLQSVIGEKLVECKPDPAAARGRPGAAAAREDQGRPAWRGPVPAARQQTMTPVGEDQIRDVMRLPYRQRFAIILNEFGPGLAARGNDLRKVIRGANPTLRELDNVVAILAKQNKELERGVAGDKVLAEWARTRNQTADAIVQAQHRRPGDRRAAPGPAAQLGAVPRVPAPAPADHGAVRRSCRTRCCRRSSNLSRSPTTSATS